MSLATIKDLATSKAARQILITKKHSPKILFVAGTVGVVGATILACRATLKMSDVLDNHEKTKVNLGKIQVNANYGQEQAVDLKTDLHKLQVKTAMEIGKLYAPAVILGVAGITALTGSHVILTKRNGAVMAAYAGLDRAYKEYRQRVANEYGDDVDYKFAAGTTDQVVVEQTADGTVKKRIEPIKDGKYGGSPYAIVFDESSKRFSREPGMNAMFVQIQQNYANDKLRANGHLFLNEVYDMLGVPRTKAGAVVGWVWRREAEEMNGDNYVSFGVFDRDLERAEAFIDGEEKAIWLDFNVDGVIYDKI